MYHLDNQVLYFLSLKPNVCAEVEEPIFLIKGSLSAI